jgi:succinate dehydrogenase/fumarate reductase flavoprotein subunit
MNQWDAETDVAVIGGGPGGCVTAVTAQDADTDVTLLEKSSNLGGNGALSSGIFCLCDTAAQRAAGISDSPELLVEDMASEVERLKAKTDGGVYYDADLAELYANEVSTTDEWLREMGFGFELYEKPSEHQVTRLHILDDPMNLRELFEDELEHSPVTVRYNCRGHRLCTDDTGRVTGVHCVQGNEDVFVRARKGVVLASGGYQANPELIGRYKPQDLATAASRGAYVGDVNAGEGDGHRMLLDAGADMVNMNLIEEFIVVASRLSGNCIAVTQDTGERFHDETGPYRERVAKLEEHTSIDNRAYYVFDSRVHEAYNRWVDDLPDRPVEAESLAALADARNIDAEGLQRQVERWNDIVERGETPDPEFGRMHIPDAPIAEPPFYASEVVTGPALTFGGARTTASMQAIDRYGDPIPGLYAIGDCNGSVLATWGLTGTHLGLATTFGRICGTGLGAD